MSIGLSQYAKRFLIDPAAREAHTIPVLVWDSASTEQASDELVLQTLAGVPPSHPRQSEPLVFEVKKSGNRANAFAMGITVGRTEANDISVDEPSVSRFHAWLQPDLRTGEWRLVDAESRNGTWIGPLRLTPNRPERLHAGARIRFGSVEMQFLPPDALFDFISKQIGSPRPR